MKTKFFQISIGVSLMLFSAGFFVRSIGSANAAPVTVKAPALGSAAYVYPMGISNGYAYWLQTGPDGASDGHYYKEALTEFKE